MEVGSTSVVNVLMTSRNDVVFTPHIDVETTLETYTLYMKIVSTSGNDVVSTSGVDVVSMSYTNLRDCNEMKGPPETPLPNVANILLEE